MGNSIQYRHLGGYSDLVAAAHKSHDLFGPARPGRATQKRFLDTLGFAPAPATPRAVRVDGRWQRDGVDGERVSWTVGYGPRTEAWVLRPAAGRAGPARSRRVQVLRQGKDR